MPTPPTPDPTSAPPVMPDTIFSDIPPSMRGQVAVIIDFGSQYVQLIARRVREAGV